MRNNIERIVIEEISKYFDTSSITIKKNTKLLSLNIDSLDAVQLGTALEEKFNIEFEFESIKNFKTIEDICDYIESDV